jgi:hypothetical protein
MKKLLISTTCEIFICGTRSPTPILHESTISASRHVAQSTGIVGAIGELCPTEYISTRDDKG